MATEISPEMRLFSPGDERLYLTAQERQRFFVLSLDGEKRQGAKPEWRQLELPFAVK